MKGFATSSWITWPCGRLSASRSVIFSCAAAGHVVAAASAAARTIRLSMVFSLLLFLSVTHLHRQIQNDHRPDHEDRDRDQVRNEVWKHAMEDFGDRPAGITRHHETVQPHRRRDHADLRSDDLDHAEPERIIA